MIKYFTVNAPSNRSLVRRLHHKVGPGCRSWTSRGRVRPSWPRRRLPVSAECLTASRWQPRRAAGVPLPSSVHQMEPAGPDLVHSVSSRDPHRGRTHTPLLGVRGPVPGRKAALLVCCHVPDRVSHGLTPLGFQTSQFRVAPTDALIQNPPSTRGRSLAGRHHGSDDVRIQDQRPSARSARCTAAWAS
jgi:hypothetical protein